MKTKTTAAILLTFYFMNFITFNSSAQDIHFSQYNQTPLFINPALTGVFNGDQRATLNYKNQWRSFGAPYKTYALSFDMALLKKKWKNSYLAAGLTAFNDKAGDSELSTSQVNISFASIVSLNANHKLSAGLQGGFAQKSIRFENLSWDEQWDANNYVYNPSFSSYEIPDANTRFGFADVSAGITYTYGREVKASDVPLSINAGVAVLHVNKPQQLRFSSALENTEALFNRIIVHSGAIIGFSENTALLPSVLYMKQGASAEVSFAAMLRLMLKEDKRTTRVKEETAVSFGGYLRTKDAFIPAFQFEYSNYSIGISYDINTSDLKTASRGQGGIELSLRYVNPSPFKYNRVNKNSTVRFL